MYIILLLNKVEQKVVFLIKVTMFCAHEAVIRVISLRMHDFVRFQHEFITYADLKNG